MITILGAGGAIGDPLAQLLVKSKQPVRLVGRNPKSVPGAAETVQADLTDREQTIRAVAGSSIVHLLVGLPYDFSIWKEAWPRIMSNAIEACARAGARLVFIDNVYMYGRVSGPMTEETPFNPCSRKGELRARIATQLIEAWRSGTITGMIARAPDFYGPRIRTGVANEIVFKPMAKRETVSWLVNDSVPHSFAYTWDVAQSLIELSGSETSWNQTWHVPTTPDPPTGRELIAVAARELGTSEKHRVLSRPLVRIAGWFNRGIGETYEMLYQYDAPYLFDSSKYRLRFGFAGTPYSEGILASVLSYRES